MTEKEKYEILELAARWQVITDVLNNEEVSEFFMNFPEVKKIYELYQQSKLDKNYKRLTIDLPIKDIPKFNSDCCKENYFEGFKKGIHSQKMKNKSGCCCVLNDTEDEVLEFCKLHSDVCNQNSKIKTIMLGDETIMIIPSGWRRNYHVITEDPTEGDYYYRHEFLSIDELCKRYNLNKDEIEKL